MEGDFHPARLRSLWATFLDAIFAAAVVATLLMAVLTMLSDNARDELARAYARQFVLKAEADCPNGFGNAFWFACASEVRRINALHAVTATAQVAMPPVAPRPAGFSPANAAPRARQP